MRAIRPLLPGNLIAPLVNGVEAYPTMLQAIESATESIGLATYIFDGAGAGERSAFPTSTPMRRLA